MNKRPATTALEADVEELLARANRQARLLRAAAQVSRNISSILDPEDLLARTVDIICDEYGFYYAGIFLIERLEDGQDWAVLKAGRGEAGRQLLARQHKLLVGGNSMIGMCTALNQARIALDVDAEYAWYPNPFLPHTRSEMALPLSIGPEVIGALTVQSTEEAAFTEEDIASLQAMADQLAVAINNARLHKQNEQLFYQASRRAVLLRAGAEVSRNISAILDLDVLLSSTVYIICEEYRFDFAAIFLVENTPADDNQPWAVLRAARGEAGRRLVEQGYRLPVGGETVVGQVAAEGEARILLADEDTQTGQDDPFLPGTRSRLALPLIVQDNVIGVLLVQSREAEAFLQEDISSLQIMADQLAVAINNARLLQRLEQTHQELLRHRTYQTIAAATGETIHWVGNKAAPIPACVERLREDVARFIILAGDLLTGHNLVDPPAAQTILRAYEHLQQHYPRLVDAAHRLQQLPPEKWPQLLNIESVLEDLDIIEDSSKTILKIKEDLIGPARQMKFAAEDIEAVVRENVRSFGLPPQMVTLTVEKDLPPVKIDRIQMGRVITNLVKNALEAMDGQPEPRLKVAIRREGDRFVRIDITDNGCGIPPEELTKIWMTFHTSKGDRGGTGLGLPACLQIMERMQGRIGVTSQVGVGSTFTLHVPVYRSAG
ncbi:MAG: GAF domain-containing protein [Chloroflexi bacterium]|nr:MAG: GAF domain-containing protein [Chloroflexota bacterium]